MIKSIKHRGLRLLNDEGRVQGIIPQHAKRILVRLDRLEEIESLEELPTQWNCHALQGSLRGNYAININAQWRLVFRFESGHVHDLDYVQYH